MKTIWKFPVPAYDERGMATARPTIRMPQGARILTLQTQNGEPTLWALVDPARPSENREFVIVGTGHLAGDCGEYVGTWQSSGFVFHLFEAPEQPDEPDQKCEDPDCECQDPTGDRWADDVAAADRPEQPGGNQ